MLEMDVHHLKKERDEAKSNVHMDSRKQRISSVERNVQVTGNRFNIGSHTVPEVKWILN